MSVYASYGAAIRRFGLYFGVWLVLSAGAPAAWLPGVLACAAATALSLRLLPPVGRGLRPAAVAAFVPGFLRASLLGGLDVAARALHPRMPLNPAWLRHPTRLPAGPARVSLGNALTLTPGTLVAGGDDDSLYVHCLDAAWPIGERAHAEERRVAACAGLAEPTGPR